MPNSSPLRLLIVGSLAIGLFFFIHWMLTNFATSWGVNLSSAQTGVFASAFSMVFLWSGSQRPTTYRLNFRRQTRVMLTTELVTFAKKEIFMYSGECNNEVFDDEETLLAFKNLPEDVKISVYCDRDIDAKSSAFRSLLDERENVSVQTDVRLTKKMGHFMLVDGQHVRMELFSHWRTSNGGAKLAVYLYDVFKTAYDTRKTFDKRLVRSR